MRFAKLNSSHRFDRAVYQKISPFLMLVMVAFLVAAFSQPEQFGFASREKVWLLALFSLINALYAVAMRVLTTIPVWLSRVRLAASVVSLALLFYHVDPTRSAIWIVLLLPFLGQVTNEGRGLELPVRFIAYCGVAVFAYACHYPQDDHARWLWSATTQLVSVAAVASCAWVMRQHDRQQRRSLFAAYNKLATKQGHLIRTQRFAALGELSSGVAHEVNNALVILIGGVDEVDYATPEDDPKRPAVLKNVDRMRRATARIHRITEQIRKLSRDFHQQPLSIFDLRTVVDDTLFLVRTRLASRGIAWEAQLPDEQLLVRGHPGEIGQVLINLINNARDALEGQNGEKKIVFRVFRDGTRARLEVIDTGPGISPDIQLKIFTPFVTTKALDKGTGLGLSISRDIVKNHDGNLSFRSSGAGTSFIVELPLASEAVAA